MEDDLSFDSILSGEEIEQDNVQSQENNEVQEENNDGTTIEGANSDFNEMIDGSNVNSEQTIGNQGSGQSSPNYSSLAQALIADGAIDAIEGLDVKDAEGFRQLLEQNVLNRMNYQQQRVNAALNAGLEPDEIQTYEAGLADLNNITQESIEDESDNGLEIRKQLIYQSALSKGLTEQQANREVQKSIKANTDIDDAKDGLNFLKQDLMNQYQQMVKQRQEQEKEQYQTRQQKIQNIQKYIIEGGSENLKNLPKNTREQMLDVLYKQDQVGQDGERMTALQKFANEHPEQFNALISYAYVMTNGGKDINGLSRQNVAKETKKNMSHLENVLRGQQSFGSDYRYANGSGDSDNDGFNKIFGM